MEELDAPLSGLKPTIQEQYIPCTKIQYRPPHVQRIAIQTVWLCCAGISLAEELDVEALLSGIPTEQKQDRQAKLTDTAWKATVEEFKSLSEAIHDDKVRANSNIHSQPWME